MWGVQTRKTPQKPEEWSKVHQKRGLKMSLEEGGETSDSQGEKNNADTWVVCSGDREGWI